MARWARWSVTLVVAAVVFGVCLWVARSVSFGWMPKAEADRWVVATAFATLMGTVAAAAVDRWANREQPAPLPEPELPAVSQEVVASGQARVNQAGGNQNTPSSAAGAGGVPGRVVQKAEASDDASVNQAGGDQNTRPEDDEQQRQS
ncbi:hypothetical protein [Streptomyces sp. 900105755]